MKFKVGDKVIYAKKDKNYYREDNLEIGFITTIEYCTPAHKATLAKRDLYYCTIDGTIISFFEHQLLPLNDMTRLLYPEAKEIA